MKVKSWQLFLRSLRSALLAAEGNSPVPGGLEALSAGLEIFGEVIRRSQEAWKRFLPG
jgi:hypothetical protein